MKTKLFSQNFLKQLHVWLNPVTTTTSPFVLDSDLILSLSDKLTLTGFGLKHVFLRRTILKVVSIDLDSDLDSTVVDSTDESRFSCSSAAMLLTGLVLSKLSADIVSVFERTKNLDYHLKGSSSGDTSTSYTLVCMCVWSWSVERHTWTNIKCWIRCTHTVQWRLVPVSLPL